MNFLHANTPFLVVFAAAAIAAVALGLFAQRFLRAASSRHAVLLATLLLPPVLFAAAALGLRAPLAAQPAASSADVSMSIVFAPATNTTGNLATVLFSLWLIGTTIALARIALEAIRWRRIAERAEPITDWDLLSRFDSTCALARSNECAEPAVIGIVDPLIVLPAAYELEPAELDAVFAHELAHVMRRDNLIALTVQIVCALFWFDPLHRIARRKLVELRERVCDELVLDRGCDAEAYITALARSTRSTLAPQHAVACMSRLKLEERMESIMTHENRRRFPVWITRAFVTVAVAVAAIGFATFSPAPVVIAGEAGQAQYDFDVHVMRHEDGRFTLVVRIDTPEGPISSFAVVRSAPDARTISTTHNGKTYRVDVQLAADGSATGKFDVTAGAATLASAGKQFAAPTRTSPMLAPPAPPQPGSEALAKKIAGNDAEALLKKIEVNMTPPKPVHTVEPIYPGEAKDNGIYGVVIIEASISETGLVTDTKVLKGLPYGLDKAAEDAVRQWRFEPATRDGKPVPVTFNLTVNFKLD